MAVDMDEKVGGGDGNMGGFTTIPEGDHLMEFTGKVEMVTSKKDDSESLMIEAAWVDDPSGRSSVFCKLSEQTGLVKLVDIIVLSGVDAKIKRKKPDFDSANLTGKVLNNPKFHEQLKNDIQGCRIIATIKHSKTKVDGVEKVYANINKITSAKKGAVQSNPGNTEEAGTQAAPAAPAASW